MVAPSQTRCSKLSKTRSTCRSRRKRRSSACVSAAPWTGDSQRLQDDRWPALGLGDRRQIHKADALSEGVLLAQHAAWIAIRVLPMPPGPRRVNRRQAGSARRSAIWACSGYVRQTGWGRGAGCRTLGVFARVPGSEEPRLWPGGAKTDRGRASWRGVPHPARRSARPDRMAVHPLLILAHGGAAVAAPERATALTGGGRPH